MDYGEQTTGTRDEQYNLVSVLYHALHGADNCERYAHDAQAAGDKDLVVFFREAQGMQAQLAERAKGLLGIAPPASEVPPGGTLPEDLPSRSGSEVPPEGMVGSERRPSTTPGDVRRGTTPDAPITPPEEAVPPDAPSPPEPRERPPREQPPPGEERPERRGEAPPTSPTPREDPPAGEERPERRTP